MNNFKGLKNLTLKRKSNIGVLIVALAIAATVPASLFAYSSSDVTKVADEIGDTAENPTDRREVTSTIGKKRTKQLNGKSVTSDGLVSTYQLNSLGTQDSLGMSVGCVTDSVSHQLDEVKLAASIAEQKATQNAEQQTEKKKKNTEESGVVYLTGDVVYKPDTHYVHRKDCKWADETCYEVTSTDSLEAFIRDLESMLTGKTNVNVTYQICSECNPISATVSNEKVDRDQVAEVVENNNGIVTKPIKETSKTTSTEIKSDAQPVSAESKSSTIDVGVRLEYYIPSVGDVYDGSGLPKTSVSYDYEGAASEAGITDYDILLLRRIVSSEYGSDWVPVEEKAKIVAGVMNMVKSPDPWYPDTIEEVLAKSCEPWGFNRYKNYYMSDSIIMAVDYYFAHIDEFGTYKSWYGDGTWNYFHNCD